MAAAEQLTDKQAVNALALVALAWMDHRGRETYAISYAVRGVAAYAQAPAWARDTPQVTAESALFARRMLAALLDGADDEARQWTEKAIATVETPRAHVVDPISLTIGGLILIGSILAARVKKVGAVEFYQGVPKELADVIKAASNLPSVT